jgi:hypothetical protein
VREADATAGLPIGVLVAWRMCSGSAHGRLWEHLSALDRQVQSTDGGVVTLRLTNSENQTL